MQNQLSKLPLDTGNWIAWMVVTATLSFYAGWVGRQVVVPVYCWFGV